MRDYTNIVSKTACLFTCNLKSCWKTSRLPNFANSLKLIILNPDLQETLGKHKDVKLVKSDSQFSTGWQYLCEVHNAVINGITSLSLNYTHTHAAITTILNVNSHTHNVKQAVKHCSSLSKIYTLMFCPSVIMQTCNNIASMNTNIPLAGILAACYNLLPW